MRLVRLVRRITAFSLMVLIVAVIFVTGWNAAEYDVLPWQAAPGRIHWCGRDYENTTGVRHTLAQIKAMDPQPIQNVGYHVPLSMFGSQLYASITPESRRHAVNPPLPCSMAVYLRTGRDEYVAYTLEGGP